jgi:hypothetical protein
MFGPAVLGGAIWCVVAVGVRARGGKSAFSGGPVTFRIDLDRNKAHPSQPLAYLIA